MQHTLNTVWTPAHIKYYSDHGDLIATVTWDGDANMWQWVDEMSRDSKPRSFHDKQACEYAILSEWIEWQAIHGA